MVYADTSGEMQLTDFAAEELVVQPQLPQAVTDARGVASDVNRALVEVLAQERPI